MQGFPTKALGATRMFCRSAAQLRGTRRRLRRWAAGCFVAILMGALVGCPTGPGISNATCLQCHDGRTAQDQRHIQLGAHRGVSCSLCHGDGEAHVRAGGRGGVFIINPAKLPLEQSIQVCAQCHVHADEVSGFSMTAHADARVSCHVCHDVHTRTGMTVDLQDGPRFSKDEYAVLCGQCHVTQVDEFLESTHAVLDVASCRSCHDMHRATMLTQPPETNALCLQCHASQALGFTSEAIIDAHTGFFHPVDPAGSGASRCTGCHMPPHVPFDADGPHNHTMFTVPPIESVEAVQQGITPVPANSCSGVAGCHDPSVPGSGSPHFPENVPQNLALQVLYESIGLVP
jgi:predicted CXXCH cytochrome family protein